MRGMALDLNLSGLNNAHVLEGVEVLPGDFELSEGHGARLNHRRGWGDSYAFLSFAVYGGNCYFLNQFPESRKFRST